MAQVLGDPVTAPPTDGITRVRWSPSSSNTLLASSWDGTARLYDAGGAPRGVFVHPAPLLDCAFERDGAFYTGGLDCRVTRVDATTSQQQVLGAHTAPIKCVEWLESRGLLATASWDMTLRLWDPRAPPGAANVGAAALPGKAYTLAAGGRHLVVGTSARHVWIYDIERLELGEASQTRESSLKYQTRCVAAHPGGYALGSVEGRVAMEYFDTSPDAQRGKYAFKCHRRNEGGRDTAYPVHAAAFHPAHGTFATGGGDGAVCIWDGANKKRLFQIAPYPTSISSLAFSADGHLLAAAASYAFERGEAGGAGAPGDQIFVRKVADAEVRPKPRAQAAA
ncbi:MAG: quinon protein alcohol dehydrogenase-like superfamily [Monoraphidium minutum]|nr:MAG: quinon protein alcohol dehydrogenase-like superfamily [Monoraphidium minutum]